MRKTFEFTFILRGAGKTEEEALNDALEAFHTDPGEPSKTEDISDEDEEGAKLALENLKEAEETGWILHEEVRRSLNLSETKDLKNDK